MKRYTNYEVEGNQPHLQTGQENMEEGSW